MVKIPQDRFRRLFSFLRQREATKMRCFILQEIEVNAINQCESKLKRRLCKGKLLSISVLHQYNYKGRILVNVTRFRGGSHEPRLTWAWGQMY